MEHAELGNYACPCSVRDTGKKKGCEMHPNTIAGGRGKVMIANF